MHNTQTSADVDAEAVAEWTSRVSRAVDLEGIANDGLGYTVTITGPLKQKKPGIRKRSMARMASLPQRKPSVPTIPEDTKMGLEIPVQREVAVRESWHSLKALEHGARWASYSSDDNIRFEKYETENPDLEYLGDQTVLSPIETTPIPPPQADIENRERGDSIDGFMALPAMPWRTNSPPPDHVINEVSARMDLLFPNNQRHEK
jgi:hypothetical protein